MKDRKHQLTLCNTFHNEDLPPFPSHMEALKIRNETTISRVQRIESMLLGDGKYHCQNYLRVYTILSGRIISVHIPYVYLHR